MADLYQRKFDSFGTTQEERFRLYVGDRQIGEIVRKDGADQTLYFHPDHLGSPETISDSNGAAYHQRFDPFGKAIDGLSPVPFGAVVGAVPVYVSPAVASKIP